MATECWKLTDGHWVLYTEDKGIKDLAVKAGLREMGTYYRRDGPAFAWQYVGNEKTVKALARLAGGGGGRGRR